MSPSFFDWSFRAGRIAGIEIRIHWLFVFYVITELIRASFSLYTALFLAVLFGTVLIHELGHCFMGRRFHLSADRILLWPLGGLAFVAPGRSPSQDFWVALAGPLTHIPLALASGGALLAQGASLGFHWDLFGPLTIVGAPPTTLNLILLVIFNVQQFLFYFNVFLPAFPMDGGRMLVSMLQPRFGAQTTALVLVWTTGISAAYLMFSRAGFLGFILAFEAYQLWHLRRTGGIYSYPGFNHATPVRSAGKPRKARQVPYLRPVGRTCPKCKRSLPDTARMCGFCEIEL